MTSCGRRCRRKPFLGETFLKKGSPPDPLPKTFVKATPAAAGAGLIAKQFLKGALLFHKFFKAVRAGRADLRTRKPMKEAQLRPQMLLQ